MQDLILDRAEKGKCPICKKELEFKTDKEGVVTFTDAKLLKYKDTSVFVCSTHPYPKSLRCSSGTYEVSTSAQKGKKID